MACYGLVGKGRLQVGWDGDLTVVDLHTTAPVHNLAACSSFTGPHTIIQDVEAALLATKRALHLSEGFQRRLHVYTSPPV